MARPPPARYLAAAHVQNKAVPSVLARCGRWHWALDVELEGSVGSKVSKVSWGAQSYPRTPTELHRYLDLGECSIREVTTQLPRSTAYIPKMSTHLVGSTPRLGNELAHTTNVCRQGQAGIVNATVLQAAQFGQQLWQCLLQGGHCRKSGMRALSPTPWSLGRQGPLAHLNCLHPVPPGSGPGLEGPLAGSATAPHSSAYPEAETAHGWPCLWLQQPQPWRERSSHLSRL